MRATGIPAHLVISRELNKLVEAHEKLEKEIVQLKLYVHADLPQSLALKVTEELRKNFEIGGVAALTLNDLDRFRDSILCELRREMTQLSSYTSIATTTTDSDDTIPAWKTWDWKDGLICHFVR
jgi:hypothetical protein